VDRALADLSAGERERSQVIRDAIIAAWHRQRDEELRREAETLAADPDDRAEARCAGGHGVPPWVVTCTPSSHHAKQKAASNATTGTRS